MVTPEKCVLGPCDTQMFELPDPKGAVTWSLSPPLGTLIVDKSTTAKVAYQAPDFRWCRIDVSLTATTGEGAEVATSTAAITLSGRSAWLPVLGVFWAVAFLLAVGLLYRVWPSATAPVSVEVYPSAVALSPGKSQQFTATVWGTADQAVTWTATAGCGTITPSGVFLAPEKETTCGPIEVTATRKADPKVTSGAMVFLAAEQLVMTRSVVTASELKPGRSVRFEAHGEEKDPVTGLQWTATAGSIDANGVFSPPPTAPSGRVIVTAFDPKVPRRRTSAVYVLGQEWGDGQDRCGRNLAGLYIAFLSGALGGILAGVRSFVGFVGNRTFVGSWGLFYLSRPVFGAGLALVVHCGYRAGSFSAPGSLDAMDPAAALFIGGLVGLFADEVLGKLKDLVSRVLQMKPERTDTMTAGSTAAAGVKKP